MELYFVALAVFAFGVFLGEKTIKVSGTKISLAGRVVVDILFGIFGWLIAICGAVSYPAVWLRRRRKQ